MDADTAIGGPGGRFPTTQLSLLEATAAGLPNEALDRVIALYWKPVYRFIRLKFRKNNEDAKDLTEGFFAAALQRDFFARFDPAKASFRTYLRMAVERFAANQHAAENRQKRGGAIEFERCRNGVARTHLCQLGIGGVFTVGKVIVLEDAKLELLAARIAVRAQIVHGQREQLAKLAQHATSPSEVVSHGCFRDAMPAARHHIRRAGIARGDAASMDLSDPVLGHLRHVAALPDLNGTRYELGSEIGRGGMGVVYAARDCELDRHVALKVLDFALAGEAQLIARLEHPGVVPIYETGTLPDGRLFYAMKLVSGARLDQYLAGHPTLPERLRVIRRVGETLAFAHSRGLIHRDLNPQNVMVGEFGEVYLMDWGVDAVGGTPAFRAPEPRLDKRSDIYALGAVLQFLLPVPASPALRAVAAKAMSTEPADRYPDATALLADIERLEQERAVEAWSEPLGHQLRRFGSRNAVLLWLLAAYTVVKFLIFFLRNP